MMRRLGLLIFFLVMASIYFRQAAPSVTTGDSGEFITAAATLSIPHAPSYPLFSLLGKAFIQMVPWGSIPLKCNYFSSICSLIALLLIWVLAFSFMKRTFPSLSIAAVAGFSHSFWLNSLVTEVFALNTLFVCLILFFLVKRNQILMGAFLIGLGLGNHHILIFFIPLLGILIWFDKEYRVSIRKWILISIFGIIGFSIYFVLPIRSAKEPPLNWGQPTTPYKLYRTVARKDYGSMKLTLGETPKRDIRNTGKQLVRFGRQLSKELPWFVAVLAFIGLLYGLVKKTGSYSIFVFLFLLFGPIFYLLGNLPFDALSDGIIGRFFIVPTVLLIFGLAEFPTKIKGMRPVVLGTLALFTFIKGVGEANAHRNAFLTWDYSNAMLRTLPPHSALFLDGGDDAFYSLATQQFVLGKRQDLEIHDRGGLIFKNPYGTDFRQLSPEEKNQRRHRVEFQVYKKKPLFYSSMDPNVLPGVRSRDNGFLLEAGSKAKILMPWSIIVLRNLYPLQVSDYRTIALAVFFPFSRGRFLVQSHFFDQGLRFLWRSQVMGPMVQWLQANLGNFYAQLAYKFLNEGKLHLSERVYRQWIKFEPRNSQPYVNLGVVLERMGREKEAEEQYFLTLKKFPQVWDPFYNLAVLSWKKSDWPAVIRYFEEVLKRNPEHHQARRYLEQGKRKILQK